MNDDFLLRIIANDLDSLVLRIEAGPAHPHLTDAGILVHEALVAVIEARKELHAAALAERHGQTWEKECSL